MSRPESGKSKQKDRAKKGMMKAKPSSRRSDAGRAHFSAMRGISPSSWSHLSMAITANYRTTTAKLSHTHHTPKVRHFREGKGVSNRETVAKMTLRTQPGGTSPHPEIPMRRKIEQEVPAAKQAPQRNEWSSTAKTATTSSVTHARRQTRLP